jgi:hypothetical protein
MCLYPASFIGWDIISSLVVDSCAAFSEKNFGAIAFLPGSLLVFRVIA